MIFVEENCMIYMSQNYISKLPQYLHEYQSWERLLDFFNQENAFLKTRLSKVLDDDGDTKLLSFAEKFQNQFLYNDDYIREVKQEIALLKASAISFIETNKIAEQILFIKRHKKLSAQLTYFEGRFAKLKNEFNGHLEKLI